MSIVNLNQKEIVAVSGGDQHFNKDELEKTPIKICRGWSMGACIGVPIGLAIGNIGSRVILAWKYAVRPTVGSRAKTLVAIFGIGIISAIISNIIAPL